jgi:hypothetical protein
LYLIGFSILAKIAMVFVTLVMLHSFLDTFAMNYYFQRFVAIFSGQIPYITYSYEYPILSFIPIVIASIPALITQSEYIFIYLFMGLMVICDSISIICVYKIADKIWNDKSKAFVAAAVFATTFSVAYFTLTEFTPFAICLMMLGLTYTVCKDKPQKGYMAIIAGFFVKIFPIITYPFTLIYNAKKTSLVTELKNSLKIFIPLAAVIILPFLLINNNIIDTFLLKVGTGQDRGLYSSSTTYMIYSWLHSVFNIAITTDFIYTIQEILLVVTIGFLLYVLYKSKDKTPATYLKVITCALFAVVFFTEYHSPNYVTWFIPLVCIFAVDDIYKIGLIYLNQIIGFIVFPLGFYGLWVNANYTGNIFSYTWDSALLLFTIRWVLLAVMIWVVVDPIKLWKNTKGDSDGNSN